MEDKEVKCSFCGRKKKDTNVLIAGITGYICDRCIAQGNNIVKEEMMEKEGAELEEEVQVQKPKEIKAYLDSYVIGQDDAKRVLSVAVYNHYKRLLQKPSGKEEDDDVKIQKSNVIMVGETGTGKTLMAKSIADMLNVPFCIADATILTEAGYVGEDVESILSRLVQAADNDVKRAEKGIVYIDEIDKVARKGDNASLTRDVSGEGVQQALLKLLEGSSANIPPQGGRKHPEQKLIQINTENILFICGGAFDGIERVISRRVKTSEIGYSSSQDQEVDERNILRYISPQDLRTYGLIPELIGRFPVLTYLHPLDHEALKRILTEPKNALIKQYVKLFEMDGIELSFDKEVYDLIVDKAIELNLGARGLRSICEVIMRDAMYEVPSPEEGEQKKELRITLDYAKEKFDNSKMSELKVA
jgi:ATP-dependent Clp protease ATP-binding subunit ClpX